MLPALAGRTPVAEFCATAIDLGNVVKRPTYYSRCGSMTKALNMDVSDTLAALRLVKLNAA